LGSLLNRFSTDTNTIDQVSCHGLSTLVLCIRLQKLDADHVNQHDGDLVETSSVVFDTVLSGRAITGIFGYMFFFWFVCMCVCVCVCMHVCAYVCVCFREERQHSIWQPG